MIFKVEKLEPNVHLIRGYRNEKNIKFCFSCVLHKASGEKQWHIHIASTDKDEVRKGAYKELKESLRYLKAYPSGVYTYVSKKDFDRFYKRFCKLIKFDDCDF